MSSRRSLRDEWTFAGVFDGILFLLCIASSAESDAEVTGCTRAMERWSIMVATRDGES